MREPNLWEQQCPECLLYDQCGGAATAPCTCIKSGEERYDCGNCDIVCRERYVPTSDGLDDTFSSHAFVGRNLESVEIDQHFSSPFPLLIPTQTNKLPSNIHLPYDWIGVDLRHLLDSTVPPVRAHSRYNSAGKALKFVRGHSNSKLLAILNSVDGDLEHFWASERSSFYEALLQSGFAAATGPTFSIYEKTNSGAKRIPDAHSVTMLRRHHRVVEELAQIGVPPIPNLYDRNERDRQRWVKWLSTNQTVTVVSCDLTCSKNWEPYREYMHRLIEIVGEVDRSLHVLLQGVGTAKSTDALVQLAEAGCTCSICTSDPILKGSNGYALIYQDDGEPPIFEKQKDQPHSVLSRRNIDVLDSHLLDSHLTAVASGFSIYS